MAKNLVLLIGLIFTFGSNSGCASHAALEKIKTNQTMILRKQQDILAKQQKILTNQEMRLDEQEKITDAIELNQEDILAKIDKIKAVPAAPAKPQRRPGPDPKTVYAFPVGDSAVKGQSDALITIIEVIDFQ